MKTAYCLPFILLIAVSCSKPPAEQNSESKADSIEIKEKFPASARAKTIYEVNIRQHTKEGTFNAFQKDLPRLKDLGSDILWIMPIQTIGVKNRKGSLGSYYSIKDYKTVNPEFGSLEDFKALVKKAHDDGFLVILDWVPNHTAWDHTWITEHPEYYMTDSAAKSVGKTLGVDKNYYKKKGIGDLVYEADWDDIALLNLHKPETRAAMIDAMRFWVEETDIDGFRTDHAGHEIPMLFWDETMDALNPLKDLFWLAEWDDPKMHTRFHATYDWTLLHLTSDVAKGKASAEDIHDHIEQDLAKFGPAAFRLNMINNHDENAWQGTVKERYGDGEKAFAVFSFIAYGTPMLYSGQEAGLDRRLKFFEKDSISWSDPGKYFPFYQKLIDLKSTHASLWNGSFGGVPAKLEDGNKDVFSFVRSKDQDVVVGIINMSGKPQSVTISDKRLEGLKDVLTGTALSVGKINLEPWQYFVLSK